MDRGHRGSGSVCIWGLGSALVPLIPVWVIPRPELDLGAAGDSFVACEETLPPDIVRDSPVVIEEPQLGKHQAEKATGLRGVLVYSLIDLNVNGYAVNDARVPDMAAVLSLNRAPIRAEQPFDLASL